MSLDAPLDSPPGAPALSPARAQEMERWRKRSRRIGLYRKALPWLMLAIVAAVVGWVGLRAVISARQQAPQGATELRMTSPRFFGRDDQGRSFQLTAREAVRDVAGQGPLTLLEPGMELDVGGDAPMSVAGGRGLYDEEGRSLVLDGGVRLQDGRGLDLNSPEAVVDTRTGVVSGEKGVSGRGPLGQLSASSYAIHDQGDRAVFSGGVRTRIEQQ